MFALTAIKGVGRRFSNIVCKKADVDLNKRAGELTEEEVSLVTSNTFCLRINQYQYVCLLLGWKIDYNYN